MSEALEKTSGTMVAFGDVVQLSKERSQDPEADGFERYVGLEHLEPSDLKVRSWGEISDGVTFTRVFRPGQVLFGKRRAYQRKVAVAEFSGVCSGDIYVLEPKGDQLLGELLPFICQSERFYEYVISRSQGGLSPRVNWKALARYEFTLPPLAEQRRIADVFGSTRKVIDTTFVARHRIDAVCNSAMGAILDSSAKKSVSGAVPIEDFGDATDAVLKTGPFGSKLKTDYFRDAGQPIITIGSIADHGLDESELFHLAPGRVEEFSAYQVKPGDIVFSRVADVGRCHMIRPTEDGYIISSNLIRIRVDPAKVRPAFVWLLLKYSIDLRKQIARLTTNAAGRLLVNTKTMRHLRFSVPSVEVQDHAFSCYERIANAKKGVCEQHGRASRLHRRFAEEWFSGDTQ